MVESGVLKTKRIGKAKMWWIYLGDIKVAMAGRKEINWVPKQGMWGFCKDLQGQGIYNSNALRKALDKLANVIENTNMNKQKEFELEF